MCSHTRERCVDIVSDLQAWEKDPAGILKRFSNFLQVEPTVKGFYCTHNHIEKIFLAIEKCYNN